MSHKQNRWLIALLCVNILLITAIVASHLGIPKAYAQVRPYDYILTPGRNGIESEALWIIDMGNRQLTTCIFNPNMGRIEFGPVLDISFAPTIYSEPAAEPPAPWKK
ncbi:MAG: hypothetical protein AMJ79_11245 [Phycisphaerae bacterium SM23_30]|nr:MAG: hypothetical protein AMJ79_11245 [Phycisphaerae bacterium SM23_30]